VNLRLLNPVANDAEDEPHERVAQVVVLLYAEPHDLGDELLAALAREFHGAFLM
jgi:hypothetical protein